VDLVNNVDRYDYDLNGGMTVRNKGTAGQQTLKWDSHARLAQVTGCGLDESYLYDETGQRVRKTNSLTGVSTFYPVAGYEQTSGAVTKHYSFGGRFRRRARTLAAPSPSCCRTRSTARSTPWMPTPTSRPAACANSFL
jgi:hypothetical protein